MQIVTMCRHCTNTHTDSANCRINDWHQLLSFFLIYVSFVRNGHSMKWSFNQFQAGSIKEQSRTPATDFGLFSHSHLSFKSWVRVRLCESMALTYLPSATKLRRLCFYRSVHRGGIPACLAAGLQGGVSQHVLQQVSGGGVPTLGGACSRGEGLLTGGCLEETPPASRRLLLRTVRILLECILVKIIFPYATNDSDRMWTFLFL